MNDTFFELTALADSEQISDAGVRVRPRNRLRIFGYIGDAWEGNTPADVSQAIDSLPDDSELDVLIESPGGSVTAGLGMFNLLLMAKRRGIAVNTTGIGMVASMAASLFMVGDERILPSTSMFMVHNPRASNISGEARDMKTAQTALEAGRAAILATFTSRGVDEDLISAAMERGTFMPAAQALDLGIATKVVEASDITASLGIESVPTIGAAQMLSALSETPIEESDMSDIMSAAVDAERERVLSIITAGKTQPELAAFLAGTNLTFEEAVEAFAAATADRATSNPVVTPVKADTGLADMESDASAADTLVTHSAFGDDEVGGDDIVSKQIAEFRAISFGDKRA